jgi:predicted ATPase
MNTIQRFVVTGGPSSGKTTLINLLKNEGFIVFNEVARSVIKQELEAQSNNVPWINNAGFSELVIQKQMNDYFKATSKVNFFDRGIPDVLGYMNHYDTKQNYKDIYQIALNHPYHSTVFLCPPWEKIYHTDSERKESFEEACKIHQEILKIYQSLQYKVIELPLVSSEKRIEIIISHIA